MELTEAIVREQFGNLAVVAEEMESFQKAAKLLSSQQPQLAAKYPNQWIAALDGKVAVHSETLESLMTEVDDRKVPQRSLIIRFTGESNRKLVV